LRSSEVLEVVAQLPPYEAIVKNLYECRYADYFKALAAVESDLRSDWLAGPHYRFICRELRIVSYNQMLAAYQSLSMASMARSFGVTPDFIEQELRTFVASGRVRCSIDQVAGLVLTRLPDQKSTQFAEILDRSDRLLDEMSKMAHLVQ
jgi:26S proteasome regulatory subunit N7